MRHADRRQYRASFFLLLCSTVLVCSNVAAAGETSNDQQEHPARDKEFLRVDCQSADSLPSGDFLLLTSRFGFIDHRKSGSPLMQSAPQEVVGLKPIPGVTPGDSRRTIILQQIPTARTTFKRLEGGIPGVWLFVAGGIAIGFLFKRSILNVVFGGLVGYIACILIMSGVFGVEENDFTIHIDNALEHAVRIQIGKHEAIRIAAKSQLSVGLEEGRHEIKVWNDDSNVLVDEFFLKAVGLKKSIPENVDWKCIYNIRGRNAYTVQYARYTSKE